MEKEKSNIIDFDNEEIKNILQKEIDARPKRKNRRNLIIYLIIISVSICYFFAGYNMELIWNYLTTHNLIAGLISSIGFLFYGLWLKKEFL